MIKKQLSIILTFGLVINFVIPNLAYSNESIQAQLKTPVITETSSAGVPVSMEPVIISPKIEKELKSNISKIYGAENTDEIYNHILKIAQKAKAQRPKNLIQEDLTRANDWYKDEIIYMFYVDQFGTITPETPNQFKDTTKMLDYLKTLGVTTIYMLPFADSPMEDSGFDVKNPQNVRKDLGGKAQFEQFIKAAKEKGFNIKADLVLNHFSDQHEWFQQALKGDVDKLNNFVVRETMPEYKKYVDEKLGTVIEYKEDDGSISKRRLI